MRKRFDEPRGKWKRVDMKNKGFPLGNQKSTLESIQEKRTFRLKPEFFQSFFSSWIFFAYDNHVSYNEIVRS